MTACRVYICDDSPEYRYLLRSVLTDVGASIVGEGGDGGVCIADVADTKPTLVLLDLNMPGIDGLAALPRVREAVPAAKLVVLTTSSAEESERQAMRLGADAFVTKPLDAASVPQLLRDKLAA